MAFKKVTGGGTLVRAATIKLNKSITGYVSKFVTFKNKPRDDEEEGSEQTNIVLILAEDYEGLIGPQASEEDKVLLKGTEVTLGSAGNILWCLKDGGIKQGLLTRITKIANKSGGKAAVFEIEQDEESALSDAQFDKIEAADLKTNVKKAVTANAQKSLDKTESLRKKMLEDNNA